MLRQIFLRKIDSSHGSIFFDVANNVRELEGQTDSARPAVQRRGRDIRKS